MAQRIVGLDIGTSAVRAVEVTQQDGAPPQVLAYGQVGLPLGAVVDGEIRDRSVVSTAIKRLWREGGFSGRQVKLGVAGLRAITRELDMPALPPDQLDTAVRFQADELVPFPLEQTAISSKVIGQYTDTDGTPTLRVLVAAAHRDLIDGAVGAVLEAGLEPTGIDLNTAALVRAFTDRGYAGGPEAIVSVGAGLTMVVVHEAGTLQFVRTIDLGGESVTKAIAGALDIPLTDAEALKRHMTETGAVDERVRPAVEAAVGELVEEIQNTIRYFASLPGRSNVSRVLLSGAGARTVGFVPKLEQALDVPLIPATGVTMVDTTSLPMTEEQANEITPTLAVPVGLALPERAGRPFNLLPTEVRGNRALRNAKKYILIAAAVVVLVIVGLTIFRSYQVHQAKADLVSLTRENAYIQNVEIPKYAPVVALRNQVATQQSQIQTLLNSEVDWLVVFNQMGIYTLPTTQDSSQTTWSSASLAAGGGANGTLGSGSGEITANGPQALPVVSDFLVSVADSPAFDAVSLTSPLAPNPNGSVSFSISFTISSTAHSQRLSLADQTIPPAP